MPSNRRQTVLRSAPAPTSPTRDRGVHALRALLAMGAAAFAVALTAIPAPAATSDDYPGREVLRWDATYALHEDGSVDVRTEIDFDFGNEPGHGVIFTLPTAQPIDDGYERVWDISDVTADSPTGAPDDLSTEGQGDVMAVRIGDENVDDVSGVQTYAITYSVAHVMNETTADETDAGVAGDEFHWNAIPSAWETPIAEASITVQSPVAATDVACSAGPPGTRGGCDATGEPAETITYEASGLAAGEPLTVTALYPSGSFDTTANTRIANDVERAFAITPWTVGIAVAMLAVGLGALALHFRRTAVDRQYAELTPGLGPVSGADAGTRPVAGGQPVAVQFEPPAGLRPGQLGTLLDEKADVRDVTATIVDQAVRGYMRIDPVGDEQEPEDYTLVKLRDGDDAMPAYGRTLFDSIFDVREQVTLTELKATFAADLAKVQKELYADVTDRGWFHRNPQSARVAWASIAAAGLVVGVIGTLVLAANSRWALVGLPVVIVSIIALVLTGAAPARTAEGTRVLAQTKGFKLFLETADGYRLRFEEGHDIFSQYLPYAIAFGIADKWSAKFAALAQEGYDVPTPTWYGAYYGGGFWLGHQNFGAQMQDFTSLTDAAISTPTAGASGGSGFSSGGGFSGGGSFGGGGGGW
ncbi:DUF2207 domain-containing protein [Demequina aestuarii]|uniref:DUF2207 domain-containing protein n=1 Tax=Demequina aestuarii TaxID=327095 RepID=UPI0007820E9F|nr:DUF2207 domain-containing protein [Demequina aestuarii]